MYTNNLNVWMAASLVQNYFEQFRTNITYS